MAANSRSSRCFLLVSPSHPVVYDSKLAALSKGMCLLSKWNRLCLMMWDESHSKLYPFDLLSSIKLVMFRIANSVHFTRFSTKNSRCSLIRECSVFTSRSHGLIKISNLPASRGLSKFSSARASSHEQGKAAFVDALRSSFVVAAKNTRSESRRQDEAFINALEDPATRPLMTSAVIEDSFWTLLEEGENMRIVKAVAHLPHDLCSNSSLNATLLAFGRMNRPSKVMH